MIKLNQGHNNMCLFLFSDDMRNIMAYLERIMTKFGMRLRGLEQLVQNLCSGRVGPPPMTPQTPKTPGTGTEDEEDFDITDINAHPLMNLGHFNSFNEIVGNDRNKIREIVSNYTARHKHSALTAWGLV